MDRGYAGLFPFTPLMKPPAGVDSASWLRRCVHATRGLPLAAAVTVDMLGGLAILSGLEHGSATIHRIISEEGLMDAIMRESSFAQYILEQGIEQGERKSTLENILDVLETRFGLGEARSLSDRLASIDDLQRLKQLHRTAIRAASMDEFRQVLDEARA